MHLITRRFCMLYGGPARLLPVVVPRNDAQLRYHSHYLRNLW